MIQTISKTITFDEFVAWYPENSVHKYELHNGAIVEMPLGISRHSRVTGFIRSKKLPIEIDRRSLPYFIPDDFYSQSHRRPYRDDGFFFPVRFTCKCGSI